MMTPDYTMACVQAARKHKDFVLGFVAQENLNEGAEDSFLCFTPGVGLPPEGQEAQIFGDGKGQRWRGPREVVKDEGADVVIVGRGILSAKDRSVEAERYRREAWRGYEERIGRSR